MKKIKPYKLQIGEFSANYAYRHSPFITLAWARSWRRGPSWDSSFRVDFGVREHWFAISPTCAAYCKQELYLECGELSQPSVSDVWYKYYTGESIED